MALLSSVGKKRNDQRDPKQVQTNVFDLDFRVFTPTALNTKAQGREQSERTLGNIPP